MNRLGAKESLAVKTGGRWVLLNWNEIDAITAHEHAACIHVGADSFFVRRTLSDLHKALPQERFLRISRRAIVNAQRVRVVHTGSHGDGTAEMNNGATHAISRRYRKFLGALYPGAKRKTRSGPEQGAQRSQ